MYDTAAVTEECQRGEKDLSDAHNHRKRGQNLALDEKSEWNSHLLVITSASIAKLM